MSFSKQSFNESNIVIKIMGGEEKLCICFGGQKKGGGAKMRGFIKIKTFQ